MGAGNVYHGFFNKAVIGAEVFEDDIFEANRQDVRDMVGKVIGEGVIDPTSAGLVISASADALNERRLTIAGAGLTTLSENGEIIPAGSTTPLLTFTDGARTPTVQDPAWWISLPYENAGATTYRVYAVKTRYPIDVDIARGGTPRGYNRFVDAPGFSVNPNSVVDTGTELRLLVDGNLTALGMQRWLTANTEDNSWSYDCIVYLDTDVTGVEIATDDPDVAIALTAKLTAVTAGTGWVVDLTGIGDGYLGQSTPSLTAGDYRIVILGPLITTTNLDASAGAVHIGTVLSGGSETISHTGQIIIRSVSDVIADVSETPNRLHHRAWMSYPGVSTSGGGAAIDFTAGEAFVGGTIVDTPVTSLTGFTAASTLFVSFNNDPLVLDFQFFADYDLARAANLVPLLRIETDGGSLVTQLQVIGRLTELYNETLFVTVSDTTSHRGQFTNLKQALAYASAVKSSAVSPKDIVIDIIGDITVADNQTITEPEFLGLTNITFRGVGGGNLRLGASSAEAGARIVWSDADDGLFELNDAATTIEGWTFENITFRYTGTATAEDVGVFVCLDGGMDSITFRGCTFDGSAVLAGQGGASGSLPHVIYYDSPTRSPRGISFDRCNIYTRDAFYVNVGDDGTLGLTVTDCRAQGPGLAPAFSFGGFIRDSFATAGVAASTWFIRDNSATVLNGPAIQANKIIGMWCHDNRLEVEEDVFAIDLGNTVTDDDVEDVFFHDNFVTREGTLGSAAVMRIITTDPATGAAVVKVHDNVFDGVTSFASLIGIEINNGNGGGTRGVSIHSNVIRNVDSGIFADNMEVAQVMMNQIEAAVSGIDVSGASGSNSQLLQAFNQIILTGLNPVGIDLSNANADDRFVVAGNQIDLDGSTGAASIGIEADAGANVPDGVVIAANLIEGADTGINNDANKATILGNVLFGVGIGIEMVSSNDLAVTGNVIDATDTGFHTASLVGGSPVVICGNVAPNGTGANELLLASGGVVVGNHLGDLDFGGTADVVLTGNYFADLDATFDSEFITGLVVNGNRMNSWTDNAALSEVVMVGNLVDASGTNINWDDGTVVGNRFLNTTTLTASSSELAVVGNRGGGTGVFTDNGTGNTVANNDV